MFSIGNCGGPLISRLYFIHGGQRIWLSSWLQTIACPLILIPLSISYFHRRKIESPATAKILSITRREIIGSTGVGIIAGLDGYFISWGPAKLPVSTSSLINATQLAFTALFAVLLVKQKLTVYSKLSVFLLIAGAATLALRGNGDRPAGVSVKEYVIGFVMTVMGAVCFGLMLSLIELIYMKAKNAISYTMVLEIQLIIGVSATVFCTIGMIINNDFQAIPKEASEYEIGEAKYYLPIGPVAPVMISTIGTGGVRICSYLRLPYTVETLLRRRCRLFTTCSASSTKEKVIVISGPTGAGKSKLALELAKRLNGEIISADSVQVYRGLDVGSAKPSFDERKEVVHHLVDILHPSEDYSVGQFFEDARQTTRDILDRGRVPIVAGGTGLYLRWFIYGKPDVPKASREIAAEVDSELASLQNDEEWNAAVQLLVKAGDPGAQSLLANDWYRLRRRLEIVKSTGSPPSAFEVPYDSFREQLVSGQIDAADVKTSADKLQQNEIKDLDYDFLCYFLSTNRIDLYRSIDFRCEDMLLGADGILSEAGWLLDVGLLPNSNSATRAIGYRQAMEYLLRCRENGGWSSAGDFYEFLSEFQKGSRNFAKRQMTWFRNEQIYEWIDASKPLEKVLSFICDSYNSQDGHLQMPESLCMRKDIRNHRQAAELKTYRTINRHFIGHEDCVDVLDWIKKTYGQPTDSLC
ncbi:hypothetical protein KY284_011793 [Solanum tuberosum]|nr:hypothetical protein KY284_011793 [Solanum tuberosum]